MSMIRPTLKTLFLGIGLLFLLLSCPNPIKPVEEEGGTVGFDAFYLSPDQNTNLSDIVIGEIEDDQVILVVPANSDNSYFCPSFETDAARVLVGDTEQYSGVSWLNFSNPVEYTLISAGGDESVVTVSVMFTGSWQDLGSYIYGYAPQIGMYNGFFPFVTYHEYSYGTMDGQYFNLANYTWNSLYSTFGSSSTTSHALAIAGDAVFIPTVTSTSPSQIDLYIYYSYFGYYWDVPYSYSGSGDIKSLAAYTRDSNDVYLSFTDNNYPVIVRYDVYSYYGETLGYTPIEYRPASSLTAAISYSGIYAAVTYEDDTGYITLYQYDESYGYWNTVATLPIANHIVKGMIYDDWNGRLIIVAATPNSGDSSQTDINIYSCYTYNSSWESLIDPLTLDVSIADEIVITWGSETVLVATNQDCYETDEEAGWIHLGGGSYYDSPSPYFSVTADQNTDRRYIAYTDTSGYYTYFKYIER